LGRSRFSRQQLRKGQAALELMLKETPSEYVRAVLSILPREIAIENITSELGAEELDTLIAQIKAELLAKSAEKPITPLIEAKLVEKVEEE
jgi:hypothetical protein